MQKKDTNRIEKLNALIQRELGKILMPYMEGQDGLVTITKVETSKDTRWAKIHISIIGGDDDEIFRIIEKNLYDIQGELNRTVNLKLIPRLQFFLDTSPRYVQHIDELIQKIHDEEPENSN